MTPQKACLLTPDNKVVECIPANGTDFTLEELYKAIGCDCIELVHTFNSDLELIVDEEGMLKDLEFNSCASYFAGQPIVGNAVLLKRGMLR